MSSRAQTNTLALFFVLHRHATELVLAHKLARAREDRENDKDFAIPINSLLEEHKEPWLPFFVVCGAWWSV